MIKFKLTKEQEEKVASMISVVKSSEEPTVIVAQIKNDGTVYADLLYGDRAVSVVAAKMGLARPSKLNARRLIKEWREKNGLS